LTLSAHSGIIRPRLTADKPIEQMTETVGERLRRLRVAQGLSQRELAAPGVSYAYISRIEAGARRPSVKALRKLAAKLGVSPDYLETGSHLSSAEERDLRLTDLELRLRLDDEAAPFADVEALLTESLAAGDALAAARARIMLGLGAARRGDNAAAIANLEDAIASGHADPTVRPDVHATLGRAYADAGDPRKAAELFERGLEETTHDAPEDFTAQVRYATYLSYALTDLGELERARTVVQEALRRGERVTDPYTRVRLYWSLGRIAHEQARPRAALDNFRKAVALLELTEDTLHLARAHLSAAGSAILTRELDDAERHLDLAEPLLGSRAEPGDLAIMRRMQADLAVARGDGAVAVARGREAAETAGTDYPNQRGLALAAVAAGLALEDDDEAGPTYAEAVELLGKHGTRRERSEVLRAYGHYLRSVGRTGEAFDVLDSAAQVAATLQPEAAVTVDG